MTVTIGRAAVNAICRPNPRVALSLSFPGPRICSGLGMIALPSPKLRGQEPSGSDQMRKEVTVLVRGDHFSPGEFPVSKTERLWAVLRREPVDGVPFNLFFHLSGGPASRESHAEAHLKYCGEAELDFLMVMRDNYDSPPDFRGLSEAPTGRHFGRRPSARRRGACGGCHGRLRWSAFARSRLHCPFGVGMRRGLLIRGDRSLFPLPDSWGRKGGNLTSRSTSLRFPRSVREPW